MSRAVSRRERCPKGGSGVPASSETAPDRGLSVLIRSPGQHPTMPAPLRRGPISAARPRPVRPGPAGGRAGAAGPDDPRRRGGRPGGGRGRVRPVPPHRLALPQRPERGPARRGTASVPSSAARRSRRRWTSPPLTVLTLGERPPPTASRRSSCPDRRPDLPRRAGRGDARWPRSSGG